MHSESVYTVFFIGFLPGFLYLGGLNSKLFFARDVPRGGGQCLEIGPSKINININSFFWQGIAESATLWKRSFGSSVS